MKRMKVYQYRFSGPGSIMNGNVQAQGIFDLLSTPKRKNFSGPYDIPAPPTSPEQKKISEKLGQDLGSMSGFGKGDLKDFSKIFKIDGGKVIHKKDFRPMNLDETGGDGKDPVQAEQNLTKLTQEISNHSTNFSVGHKFVQHLFSTFLAGRYTGQGQIDEDVERQKKFGAGIPMKGQMAYRTTTANGEVAAKIPGKGTFTVDQLKDMKSRYAQNAQQPNPNINIKGVQKL